MIIKNVLSRTNKLVYKCKL